MATEMIYNKTFFTTSFKGAMTCVMDIVGEPKAGDDFMFTADVTDTGAPCWTYETDDGQEFGYSFDCMISRRPDCYYDVTVTAFL